MTLINIVTIIIILVIIIIIITSGLVVVGDIRKHDSKYNSYFADAVNRELWMIIIYYID